MERRVPYAAALVTLGRTTNIGVDDHTRDVDTSNQQGAVFTVHNGRWFEEIAITDLSPDTLRQASQELVDGVRLEPQRVEIDPGGGGVQHFRTATEIDPRGRSLSESLDWVADLHRRLRGAEPALINANVSYLLAEHEEVFVNRGCSLTQEVVRVRLNTYAVASNGASTGVDFDRWGGTGGLELLGTSDHDLARVAEGAVRMLAATPAEPGEYQLVVGNDVTGVLAHESFGHGVELDMFVKDRALAEEYVGRRVGSDLVNILDDPSLEGGYGSYFFDHEGRRSAPTHIVADGIFERGLTDLMSATELGVPRSANGRRQDVTRKAYARMSNTFFAPGTSSVDELVGTMKRGLLVEKFTHGMEDPKGWGILVTAHVGHEIVDGKRTGKLVTPVGITGYVPDVLGSVDGVADDFLTVPASCGKGHKEFVSVSTGGPHVRFTARVS
jgi:TldD protein